MIVRPKLALWQAIPAIVVCIVVGVAVANILAAGPAAVYLVKDGSLVGNAALVNNPNAIGGLMVQFGVSSTPTPTPTPTATPTPTPGTGSCALPKFPTQSCTGVPVGTNLVTINGNYTVSTAGAVVDGKLITGDLIVSANNVVIKNSEIHGQVRNSSGQSFTLQDSLVGPTSGCDGDVGVGFENYAAIRVRIRNFGDGFRVSGDNVNIQDSFVDLCSNPGDHSDGIQGYVGGVNVTVNHNTIDQRHAQDVTSPIFFADDSESAIVINNLLMGGGYTLRLHDDFTPDHGPWTATGNRIVDNSWDYGPVSMTNTNCATTTWSDNRLVTIDASYNITSLGATVSCN